MVYKVLGLMSGSSLDGLDVVFVALEETSGSWRFDLLAKECFVYDLELKNRLATAIELNALEYQSLNIQYGHYLGKMINQFIADHLLHHQVNFVASHGHTTFHLPGKQLTHQLGDGAAIAAETGLPVITHLRSLDVALGGQGAPVVPIGEKLLFHSYDFFLNIGGIANISIKQNGEFTGFDVCAANKVLNLLVSSLGIDYDHDGQLAAKGIVNQDLLKELNALSYYQQTFPKSLANSFGTDVVYPIIRSYHLNIIDALATYCVHIAQQLSIALSPFKTGGSLFITGGGAFNKHLVACIEKELEKNQLTVFIPDDDVVMYKEALIIALMGALRWREQNNVMNSVTGASRNSIGGALWLGTEG